MATEIELRFRVSPAVRRRLLEATTTTAGALGRAATRDLHSTYFDRADLGLSRQGIGVRMRSDGRDRVMTVKIGGTSSAWLGTRREWNLPQSGDEPNLARLKRHLPPDALTGPLTPVFRSRVTRTTRTLKPRAGVRIELALDRGSLAAGRRRARIDELELELKSGRPLELYTAAMALHRELGPFRLQPSTKSARGLALAEGTFGPAVHAEDIALRPDQSTEKACKAILRSCLAQIMANQEPARRGADSEGVHQLRVGVRRLRAALSWLRRALPEDRRATINAEFRWLARELGPARDWDVFIEERLEPAIERGEVGDQAANVRARAKSERDAAYRGVRRALGSARYTAVMLDAMAWLEEPWDHMVKRGRRERLEGPIADMAWRILRDADRALRDIGEPPDEGNDAALHAVRIAAKKARYAAECLASLAPPAAVTAYVKALKRIQDSFGYRNDTERAAVLIRRLVDPTAEGDLPRLIEAIAHPVGIERTRGRMAATWGAFSATMPIHRALGHGS